MNRNAIIGLALILAAGVLACVCVSARGGLADGLFGKALWYLPYVALVAGVREIKESSSPTRRS